MTITPWRAVTLAACFALLSACGDSGTTGPKEDPDPTPARPATLAAVSNTVLSAEVAAQVPLRVRVLGETGRPVAGAVVEWSATAGTLSSAAAPTDAAGEAAVSWTLGTRPGDQVARATVAGLPAVNFLATTTPGTAATLGVTPAADTLVPGRQRKLAVRVEDRHGNVLATDSLHFTSSDSLVARVDGDGTVTAVGAGEALITVAAGSARGSYRVWVTRVTRQIAAGGRTSCALVDGGAIYCWGGNLHGVLGRGSDEPDHHRTPARVSGPQRFRDVRIGHDHACAVTTTGEAYCWGSNRAGQLGTTTTETCRSGANRIPCSTTPVRVDGGHRFRIVSPGTSNYTCGITLEDRAYCWGSNTGGQLGNGTRTASTVPVQVAGGQEFRNLEAGRAAACATTYLSEGYCWGEGGAGQLGTPLTSQSSVPVRVYGNHRFEVIRTTSNFACGIADRGIGYCWGLDLAGLFVPAGSTWVSIPTVLPGGRAFTALDVGGGHGCAIATDTRLYCGGANSFGQLGLEPHEGWRSMTLVPTELRFASISLGELHTCGLTADGQVYCWGLNTTGQLGDGTLENRFTPAPVRGLLP